MDMLDKNELDKRSKGTSARVFDDPFYKDWLFYWAVAILGATLAMELQDITVYDGTLDLAWLIDASFALAFNFFIWVWAPSFARRKYRERKRIKGEGSS